MRTVVLHGALAKKYGKSFEFEAETASEIIRALSANFVGFSKDIFEGSWHIVRGKTIKGGMDLGEEEIVGMRLGAADLHILPYVAGSKNGGVLKIVLGVALIGLSFGFAGALAAPISTALFGATTWGNAMAYIGFSLAISGMSTLLAPETDPTKNENEPSFVSSGPGNTNSEGAIVPIVYGEVITGAVLASGGITIEKI